MATKICPHCQTEIDAEAVRCYNCKNWIEETSLNPDIKAQEFLPTMLFAYFWGIFGIHRFYTGSTAIGTIQLFTLGGCGIWSYIDFIMICFNKFKDGKGRLLTNFDQNIGVVAFVLSLIPLVILLFILFFMAAIYVVLKTN